MHCYLSALEGFNGANGSSRARPRKSSSNSPTTCGLVQPSITLEDLRTRRFLTFFVQEMPWGSEWYSELSALPNPTTERLHGQSVDTAQSIWVQRSCESRLRPRAATVVTLAGEGNARERCRKSFVLFAHRLYMVPLLPLRAGAWMPTFFCWLRGEESREVGHVRVGQSRR
jgi:hypothetical protein